MKVVKIGATWCNGCLVMRPRWKEIELEYPWLNTTYLDYDEHADEVKKYRIEDTTLPVFIFLDAQGNEIKRLHGEVEKQELIQTILDLKER